MLHYHFDPFSWFIFEEHSRLLSWLTLVWLCVLGATNESLFCVSTVPRLPSVDPFSPGKISMSLSAPLSLAQCCFVLSSDCNIPSVTIMDWSRPYIIYAAHTPTSCLWSAGRSLGGPRGALNILLETKKIIAAANFSSPALKMNLCCSSNTILAVDHLNKQK